MLEHPHLARGTRPRCRGVGFSNASASRLVDGAPAALDHQVREREVVAEARVDVDVVRAPHGVDRAVAAGDRARLRLLLAQPGLEPPVRRPRRSSRRPSSSTSRPQTYATSGSAKRARAGAARRAPRSQFASEKATTSARRLAPRRGSAPPPCRRAGSASSEHARLARGDLLDDRVRAVGRRVRGDDDLERARPGSRARAGSRAAARSRPPRCGGDDHRHASAGTSSRRTGSRRNPRRDGQPRRG